MSRPHGSRRSSAIHLLFLVGYLFLTLLIAEQDRTIANQRALIRGLFDDSSQLAAMKLEKLQEEARK